MAPKRQKGDKKAAVALKKKRRAEEEAWEQPAGFFLDDDDDDKKRRGADGDSDDGDGEAVKESAEEKRLRLAREYLERVQADVGPSGRRAERFQGVTGGSDEDGSDEEDGGARDHVAERLRHDADEV